MRTASGKVKLKADSAWVYELAGKMQGVLAEGMSKKDTNVTEVKSALVALVTGVMLDVSIGQSSTESKALSKARGYIAEIRKLVQLAVDSNSSREYVEGKIKEKL